jgi:ribosome-associated protein
MIRITSTLSIDENELSFTFARSSGPGGQNVNKVETAVQLRFDVAHSPSLPPDVKARLRRLAGSRMTDDGELVITAQQYRSQHRNRSEALDRLCDLIRRASQKPRRRKATRPSKSAREKRITSKKQRGQIKKMRRPPSRAD